MEPPKPKRQIVNFSLAQDLSGNILSIFALANDGTLWELDSETGQEWHALPELPQPDEESNEKE